MTEPPPRVITPFVRYRATMEPRVRAGWLLAVVLGVIGLSLAAQQYLDWSRLHRAVASGTIVQATIEHAEEFGQRKFSPSTPMYLIFTYNGVKHEILGTLEGIDRYVSEGEEVSLHIDPADPENWTSRSDVRPLSASLVGPILVLPVVIVVALATLLARAKVLKTYRDGTIVNAVVSANKQTPLAPRSRAILCSATNGGRVIEVFVPKTLATLAAGDAVQVILPLRGGRPLAAAWFEEVE